MGHRKRLWTALTCAGVLTAWAASWGVVTDRHAISSVKRTHADATTATADGYRVLQLNICNSGRAPCYSGRAITEASRLIRARRPSVVTVNETCRSDLAPIRAATGYRGVFTQSGIRTCANGAAYGNAILVPPGTRTGAIERLTYAAQDPDPERRTLTCLRATGVTVCVTHLDNVARREQAAEMERLVERNARRGPTVLSGDWNMRFGGDPNAQNYVPAGMFRKGDRGVQHVLASTALGFVRTRITALDWTDHPALEVTLQRNRPGLRHVDEDG